MKITVPDQNGKPLTLDTLDRYPRDFDPLDLPADVRYERARLTEQRKPSLSQSQSLDRVLREGEFGEP